MRRQPWILTLGLLAGLGAQACSDDSSAAGDAGGDTGSDGGNLPDGCDVLVEPSENDFETIQAVFTDTPAESTICFAEGTYRIDDELSLNKRGMTLRGQGAREDVIFDFSEQVGASNGILVTGDDFTIETLSLLNSPADSLRVEGTTNVIVRDLEVRWDGEPREENGSYAIFPIGCEGVLIEDSTVFGASDAGIYVGQSNNIIIRNNVVHGNVAGIEIENATNAEVNGNHTYDNAAGILAFNLPDLPVQGGARTRIFDNNIENNNRQNFAPEGNIVALAPTGTGVLLLAYDEVEVHDNTFTDNDSTAILVVSTFVFSALGGPPANDPNHDPYPETIWIHDNTYDGNGTDPKDVWEDLFPELETIEEVVWDGMVDAEKPNEDGALDLCISEDDATFRNFDLPGAFENPSTDITPHLCEHDSLPPLDLFPPSE